MVDEETGEEEGEEEEEDDDDDDDEGEAEKLEQERACTKYGTTSAEVTFNVESVPTSITWILLSSAVLFLTYT